MNNEDKGQIVLFQTEDGQTKLEVQLQDETVWLTIDQMAELFQRNRSTISRHIKRIYDDGELSKETTCAKFACVVNRGIRGMVDDFLRLSNRELLTHAGKISAEIAKQKADAEYDKFRERTKYELSPVEIHFIDQFEAEQKRLKDNGKK